MTKYEKGKLLGSGTYGKVWLVKSKVSKTPFVMKEINLTSMKDSDKQQALSEVSILSQCSHNNIIAYKDATVDQSRGVLIIIMEYAEGGDLFSAILNQKGVSFKERLIFSWFIQTCLALQYIHFQNILHRDLKSQNIFITRNKVIKVGDFGIARRLKEKKELATTAIGTPYYLSPEICLGKPYDYKSDIWALGCILFEMTALAHPFQAANFPDLVSLILKGKRRDLPKMCSPLIKDLVQSMLNLKPENRPSTDEILALRGLQPYLSEYFTLHGSKLPGVNTLPSAEKSRRSSLSGLAKKDESSVRRRASLSAGSSRIPKFKPPGQKEKCTLGFKTSSNSRAHPGKVHKPSPLAEVGRSEVGRRMTYRLMSPKRRNTVLNTRNASPANHSSPLLGSRIFKKILLSTISSSSKNKVQKSSSESDCGYLSSETFKKLSGKLEIPRSSSSSTEFSKSLENLSIQTVINKNDDITTSDVFIQTDSSNQAPVSENGSAASENHCHHSFQCPQCMLDMLWKNRIRGQEGALINSDERSRFATKLQTVFSGDLFHSLYQAFLNNWDRNESASLCNSFQTIMNSLSYNQVQHLPHLMHLVQLDKILNCERAE